MKERKYYKGKIEKIGIRTYCLWYSNSDGLHFKGKFNVLQAKKLMEELRNEK